MTKVPGLFIGAFALMLATAPNLSAQTLAATLNGGEETPILNTGAVGTAEVSVDVANQEILVTLRVFNAPTPTTAGHIHIGPVGIVGVEPKETCLNTLPETNGAWNRRCSSAALIFRKASASAF